MPEEASPSTTDPARERIETEHRLLRETFAKLGDQHGLQETVELLEELKVLLVPHFAREEDEDGFPALTSESNLIFAEQLERICIEHREIIAALDQLLDTGRRALEGPVREVIEGARQLAQDLHEHEERETNLIMDALYVDLGGG